MIFLGQLNKITEEKFSIGFIHYMPFDKKNGLGKTKEGLEKEGILIENLPEPKQIKGKQAIMYFNPIKKEVFYEYNDIPKSKEEMVQDNFNQLKEENKELKKQLEEQKNMSEKAIVELTNLIMATKIQ